MTASPACEVHVPIAPTPSFLLRTRLLAASLERFGGLNFRLVVTVNRDVEPYDLHAAQPWSREAGIEWRWVDAETYAAQGWWASAIMRLTYDFEAPFVLMLDGDTLCTGSLTELPALCGDGIGGVMGWVTPMYEPMELHGGRTLVRERFWQDLFAAAGLPAPELDQEHAGWRVMNDIPAHRYAPPYFNFGMLAGRAAAMRAVGASIMDDLAHVDRFVDTRFRCQLALMLAGARTGTPLVPLPLRFNFPKSRWFWDAYPDERDVRVLHYAQTDEIDRDALCTPADLEALATRAGLSPPNALMRDRVAELLSRPRLRSAYDFPSMDSPSSARNPVVVVLGFHRSGTSMVTRLMNLLGVELGDEDALLGAEERDNARGYWEPRWMIELNEQILAALGSDTFEPFAPEPGWERSPQLEPLRERARALLAEHFPAAGRWGWKDPRTSLTLPFWRELVDAPLRCVVCVRSPADAVASALKRGIPGIERWTYAERWLDYTAAALDGTRPDERTLVFYEDVLDDPEREVARLASFLGVEPPAGDRLEELLGSVDPQLRHHVTSPWDVAVDPGLPLETRALYLLLRAARSLDGDVGRLGDALERVGAELREGRRATLAGEHARRQAEHELESLRERVEEAGRELREGEERRDAERYARDAAIVERDERIAELERVLAERDASLGAIIGSRSWRLTAPLRSLAGRARDRT